MPDSNYHCTFCQKDLASDPRSAPVTCDSCGRINKGEEAVDTVRQDSAQIDTSMTLSKDSAQNLLTVSIPGMELVEELGAGGFGTVYRAHQKQFGRDVAVKILHAQDDANEDDGRFLSEAIITGNLQHPNIVPVHDLGKDNLGHQFFSMKIAKGQLLSDIINKLAQEDADTVAHFDLPRLLQIFIDICDAIAYAHNEGIIHRDLKPNNIMVGEFGQVYVLDWGLAKVCDENDAYSHVVQTAARAKARMGVESKMTLAGTVMGTPGYMSPEQSEGNLDTLDEKSDIFSLGIILYELLCLKSPIIGDKIQDIISNTIKGHFNKFNMRLQQKRAEAELAAICARCMAINPKDRYLHIYAIIADIRGVLDDRDVSVYKSPLIHRGLRWTRQNRGRTSAVLILLSILVVGSIAASSVSSMLAKQRAENAEREQKLLLVAQSALEEQIKAEAAKAQQEHELRVKQERHGEAYALYINALDLASRPTHWKDAIALLNKALDLNPQFVEAIFTRASVYRGQHQYDLALADCALANETSMLVSGYGHAHALSIAGDIWRDRTDGQQDLQKALAFYQQCAVLNPENPYVHFSKVFIQYLQQGSEFARTAALEAVEQFPEYWESHYLLGYLYLSVDKSGLPDYQVSARNYTRALKLQPAQAKLYQNRGGAYFLLYQTSEIKSGSHLKAAIKDFEIAAALDPNNPVVWRNLLRIYYQVIGDYDQALEAVDKLEPLVKNQSNLNLAGTRAYIYEGLKDYERALQSIEQALLKDPNNADFQKFKRDMQKKLGIELPGDNSDNTEPAPVIIP